MQELKDSHSSNKYQFHVNQPHKFNTPFSLINYLFVKERFPNANPDNVAEALYPAFDPENKEI